MMGVSNAELWNNLGLCCFYASQYDMTLRCFEQALLLSDDATKADVWCVQCYHQSSLEPAHSGGSIVLMHTKLSVSKLQVDVSNA